MGSIKHLPLHTSQGPTPEDSRARGGGGVGGGGGGVAPRGVRGGGGGEPRRASSFPEVGTTITVSGNGGCRRPRSGKGQKPWVGVSES